MKKWKVLCLKTKNEYIIFMKHKKMTLIQFRYLYTNGFMVAQDGVRVQSAFAIYDVAVSIEASSA